MCRSSRSSPRSRRRWRDGDRDGRGAVRGRGEERCVPEVPAELVESARVAAVAPLVTTLPNWSWTWTAKGPTLAVALTVWLPETVEVKASLLAAPATMVKPLVVVPVTAWVLTVAPAKVIVGALTKVSE